MDSNSAKEARRLITALEMSGDHRVLSRFVPEAALAPYETETAREKSKVGMVLITKAAGPRSPIFDLAYLMVRFGPQTGTVYEVESVYSGTEDAGFPVSEAAMREAGLEAAQFRGSRFNDDRISGDANKAVVVLCHGAEGTRIALESRFPVFANKWFICSKAEPRWIEMGKVSTDLAYLAGSVGGFFYDSLRSLMQAQALTRLLNQPGPEGGSTLLKSMLDHSARASYRVWLPQAKRESANLLKGAGYNAFHAAKGDAVLAGWMKEVHDPEEELGFAKQLPDGASEGVVVEKISGRERYSARLGETDWVFNSGAAAPDRSRPASSEGRQPRNEAPAAREAVSQSATGPVPSASGGREERRGSKSRPPSDFPI